MQWRNLSIVMIAVFGVICISLIGCSGKGQADYGDNYEKTKDSQNFFTVREATATKNGFYVILGNFL